MDMMRRILGLMKPYRLSVALSLLLQSVIIATRLLMPMLTRAVVNDVIIARRLELLGTLCLGILGLTALRALSSYVRSMTLERASQSAALDLRCGLYEHLHSEAFSFFDQERVGRSCPMTGDLEGIRLWPAASRFDNFILFSARWSS